MNVAIFVFSKSDLPGTGTAHMVIDNAYQASVLMQVARNRHGLLSGQWATAWWRQGRWYHEELLPPKDVCIDCLLAVLDGS